MVRLVHAGSRPVAVLLAGAVLLSLGGCMAAIPLGQMAFQAVTATPTGATPTGATPNGAIQAGLSKSCDAGNCGSSNPGSSGLGSMWDSLKGGLSLK